MSYVTSLEMCRSRPFVLEAIWSRNFDVFGFRFVEAGKLGLTVISSGGEGAVVHAVLPNLPAERAGLLPGDALAMAGSKWRSRIGYESFLEMCKRRPVVEAVTSRSRNPTG